MRGRRRDGLPAELGHAIYSERQRVIVLTFESVDSARAFDELDLTEVAALLVEATR